MKTNETSMIERLGYQMAQNQWEGRGCAHQGETRMEITRPPSPLERVAGKGDLRAPEGIRTVLLAADAAMLQRYKRWLRTTSKAMTTSAYYYAFAGKL